MTYATNELSRLMAAGVAETAGTATKPGQSEAGDYGVCGCGASFFRRGGSMKRKCDDCIDANRRAVRAVQRKRSTMRRREAARHQQATTLCKMHSSI